MNVMRWTLGMATCHALVVACGAQDAAPAADAEPGAQQAAPAAAETQIAQGTLHAVDGTAAGTARIEQKADGTVVLRVEVTGLPAGTHGTHIHTVGACDASGATPFSSAGGHFNPTSQQHGRNNPAGPHAGDLPNLVVDASGRGQLEATLQAAHVATGAGTLFDDDGSAIVVHANADDEMTDAGPDGPGKSGARIACGVITHT
jgi:superoxide dismutase, Cu-Zn family